MRLSRVLAPTPIFLMRLSRVSAPTAISHVSGLVSFGSQNVSSYVKHQHVTNVRKQHVTNVKSQRVTKVIKNKQLIIQSCSTCNGGPSGGDASGELCKYH